MSANTETTGVNVGDVFERVTDIDSHRRAGSQFRIEEVDGEGAYWERRMYCLSPRYLLDETRYKRVVTPPIAAPAAHVERRKGQRYRRPGGRISTIVGAVNDDVWEFSPRDPSGENRVSEGWVAANWTLLADAPPEPAKCPGCGNITHRIGGFCSRECEKGCAPAKSPPAQEAPKLRGVPCTGGCGLRTVLLSPLTWICQTCVGKRAEAPKAAPMCAECDHAQPNVCMRVTREARELLCDICMTRKEEQVIDLMGQEPRAVPYKGPTRLPSPQLAADWVEDCLPEAGR